MIQRSYFYIRELRYDWLRLILGRLRLFYRIVRHLADVPRLCHEATRVNHQPGKGKNVTAYASPEVIEDVLLHIHAERRSAV